MSLFFSPDGPGLLELARQALSSTQRGYDLLAPKFDRSPFRTSDAVLDATARALGDLGPSLGPFNSGLDLCCGTGAGVDRVLRRVCGGPLTGVDFSAGMLTEARRCLAGAARWVRADARSLPFTAAFDLAVSFGAYGHFLPRERPQLFAQIHAALRPGGLFAFPIAVPSRVRSGRYWTLWAFDIAMRLRNALWCTRFIMYYRTWPIRDVRRDLQRVGFTVTTVPLGSDPDHCLVLARRQRRDQSPAPDS